MKLSEKLLKQNQGCFHKLDKSLKALVKGCDLVEKMGVRIKISSVGRVCQKEFGYPKEQSIRNNEVLREYVLLRSKEQVIEEVDVQEMDMNKENWDRLIEIVRDLRFENEGLRELVKNVFVSSVKDKKFLVD